MEIQGKVASGGKALGVIYEVASRSAAIDESTGHGKEESVRLYAALEQAKQALEVLAEEARERVGDGDGDIFLIHRLLLEDEDYLAAAERSLAEGHTAEYALESAKNHVMKLLTATGDALLIARCDDIRDISRRVARYLSKSEEEVYPDHAFLYLAEDITPSEVLALDKTACVGIVLKAGSLRSHAAILATAMALPMLVEARGISQVGGLTALLDGERGCMIVSPSDAEQKAFLAWCEEKRHLEEKLAAFCDVSFSYPSGRRLTVAANVGSLAECERALKAGAEGVGLFRSEFLFMETPAMPSEEEQFQIYRRLVELTSPHRAVIRTLDIGADKMPSWFSMAKETNPALGLRGIRLSLQHKELFLPQLRALLRASAYGNLVILLPMVTSVSEVRAVRALLDELREGLLASGVTVGHYTLGVMIETPAAALIARRLCEEVRYFSIGSNDLTQYTLALDRENPRLSASEDPRHEAVLRLISETVAAAHEYGVTVALCGELAGDRALIEWLLSLEIDVLSLSASRLLAVKERVADFLQITEKDEI
ncbi:MAG: phosphoenolpyruvate--protein phosphotransferase [Clostridia bacterium]|nr:phosphoenolpyruvate--protein phosphotransferase [Clostridia bacterium]